MSRTEEPSGLAKSIPLNLKFTRKSQITKTEKLQRNALASWLLYGCICRQAQVHNLGNPGNCNSKPFLRNGPAAAIPLNLCPPSEEACLRGLAIRGTGMCIGKGHALTGQSIHVGGGWLVGMLRCLICLLRSSAMMNKMLG